MRTFILTAVTLAAAFAAVRARADEAVATLLPPPVASLQEAAIAATTGQVAVPVLKQAVGKGETISADNLTTLSIPVAQAYPSTVKVADELIGQQAVRPLVAGQPVNRMQVRVAPSVSRNQTVSIVYRHGGVELTGRGQALEDGQVGQNIRVINPATRSTIVGTIAEGGIVNIN